MGSVSTTAENGLASALFSPVQQRVLGLLFGQPERKYQSAELIRLADSGTGAVLRQLQRLEAAGLVLATRSGNQKHYQANRDAPVFAELNGLITKTVGLVGPLQTALAPLAQRMAAAFVYGSIARGSDRAQSDIDLMIVSDELDYAEVYAALEPVEAFLSRPIHPTVLTRQEWKERLPDTDSFAGRVASRPRLFVVGTNDALT